MKTRLLLAVACMAGLFGGRGQAGDQFMFDGPSVGRRENADIRLSAFQKVPLAKQGVDMPPEAVSLVATAPLAPLPGAPKPAPVHPHVASHVEPPAPPLAPNPAAKPLPSPPGAAVASGQPFLTAHPAPDGGYSCGDCSGGFSASYQPRLWDLFHRPMFDPGRIELGGWVNGGFSSLGNAPADRFNGPVTFNDRNLEGQMNQLWFYLERTVDPCTYGFDIGGRIDVMAGTDAEFIQATDGLEADWNQTNRFYQAALPQFYADAAWNDWTVRAGRFFTPLGFERPAAPDNFFYSHSYQMQYGKPFTHLGMLVGKSFDQWTIKAGLHRGNDQFDDTDGLDALNFLGGVGYTSFGGCFTAEYALTATEEGPGRTDYIHSILGKIHATPELQYVLVNNFGQSWNEQRQSTAVWYGISQYVTYQIAPELAAGVRLEWFCDLDGTRVRGIRDGNTLPSGLTGDFYEITLGVNWTPREHLRVRPEVRWDYFDPIGDGVPLPYDAGERDRQFMFAVDVLYSF